MIYYAVPREDIQNNHALGLHPGDFVTVLDAFDLKVDPQDQSVVTHLISNACWEPWVTSWMTYEIQSEWNCLDLGANFGYYTGVMAALAPDGRTVAFEPNPIISNMLEESKIRNYPKWENVEILHKAVGEKKETLRLTMNSHLQGSASLALDENYYREWGADLMIYDVPVVPLDSIGFAPQFIKIDVEGFEPEAFKGGSKTIAQAEVIAIEVTPAHPAEFLDYLFNNFNVSNIGFNGQDEPVTREQIATSNWWMLSLRKK